MYRCILKSKYRREPKKGRKEKIFEPKKDYFSYEKTFNADKKVLLPGKIRTKNKITRGNEYSFPSIIAFKIRVADPDPAFEKKTGVRSGFELREKKNRI